MPNYEYRCSGCGRRQNAFRTVEMRHAPLACECGGEAHKLISRPNIAMLHWAYDGNPVGLSSLDQVEQMKRDDKEYEAAHEHGSSPAPGRTMGEIMQSVGGGAA